MIAAVQPTSSVTVLRAIARALDAVRPGHSTKLLTALDVAATMLEDPDRRVPYALLLRAWEIAPELAEDPDFGLHAAELAPLGTFDVVDYVTSSCRTLGEGFAALARFQRLLHDAVQLVIEPGFEVTRVRHAVIGYPSGIPRHGVEAAMGTWVVRARALVGGAIGPLEITFQHPRPARTAEHRRVLGCPVRFSATHAELVMQTSVMELPMRTADPALGTIMCRQADAAIARLPAAHATASAVRQVLATGMETGDISLARVAGHMGLRPRTLQRALAAEGATLAGLLDELRRETASSYLATGGISLTEIAFLLGFSEVSAFHRAYRRWTGHAPGLDRGRRPTVPR
jgi:AraC-like DNA-binding protein